ncbi:AAA family ATPase [Candidatus Woesearchaeota archaeon]|nr:AAA family ATPase [Candidatus Woesearchaeota archaeon]
MIIGLTGKNAAGKGEAAKYIGTKGFVYFSLSDAVREEATKRNLEHSRDNLIKLGNELRKKYGADYLAKQVNGKIKQQLKINKNQNFVIDSIRSPYEAKELMKNRDFALVGIDARIEIRFKRLLDRNRLGDAKTLEDLKQQEQRENLKTDANQQLDRTFGMADKVIVNDGSLNDLYKKIDSLLKELKWQE